MVASLVLKKADSWAPTKADSSVASKALKKADQMVLSMAECLAALTAHRMDAYLET